MRVIINVPAYMSEFLFEDEMRSDCFQPSLQVHEIGKSRVLAGRQDDDVQYIHARKIPIYTRNHNPTRNSIMIVSLIFVRIIVIIRC